MNKIKVFILSSLMMLAASFAIVPFQSALAATPQEEVCGSVDGTGNCGSVTGVTLGKAIRGAISILSIIVGIAAVIMIIVSGLKYVTSGGDSSSVSSAKDTLVYAIIGLIIAISAQVIVRFVLDSVN